MFNQHIEKQEAGKTISVINLPDGYHKQFFEKIVSDAVAAKVCVVMVLNKDKTCAAFIGYPHLSEIRPEFHDVPTYQYNCSKIHTAAQVKRLGDKLSQKTAFQLFPDWIGISYKEK